MSTAGGIWTGLVISSKSPISKRFVSFDIVKIINILVCVFWFCNFFTNLTCFLISFSLSFSHGFILLNLCALFLYHLSFSPLAMEIYYQSSIFIWITFICRLPVFANHSQSQVINTLQAIHNQWWSQEFKSGGARSKDKIESKKLININNKINKLLYDNVIVIQNLT